MRDLRFGWRTLWRSPGFTLVAVLILSLGIGATVAMVATVRSVFFHQLPFDQPERIMVLWRQTARSPQSSFSFPTYRDLEERNRSFESLTVFRRVSVDLVEGEREPERLEGLMVSSKFLRTLGITPSNGRDFLAEDDRLGAERTVLISHELWQRRLGGEHGLLGSALHLGDHPYTIIGVLPSGISTEPFLGREFGDIILPIGTFFDQLPVDSRDNRPRLTVIGRLEPGVRHRFVSEDLARISRELSEEYPRSFTNALIQGESYRRTALGNSRETMMILSAAVALVLLIGGMNLVNLQLVRGTRRGPEFFIRIALGTTPGRLACMWITENILLTTLSGLTAMAVALWGSKILPLALSDIPYIEETRFDLGMALLTFALALLMGLLIAVMTAPEVRRRSMGAAGIAARSTVPNRRLRQMLVVFELLLAVLAFLGASLLLSSIQRLRAQDPGFSSEGVMTLQLTLPQWKHKQGTPWVAFFDELLESLQSLQEIEKSGLASSQPFTGARHLSITAAGDRALPETSEMAVAVYNAISPGYFDLLDIPLTDGRFFDPRDDDRNAAARVVVISQSLADHFWLDTTPLGKKIAFEFEGTSADPVPFWRTVVGVVGEVRHQTLRAVPFAAYVPYTQRPRYFEGEDSVTMTLLVKARFTRAELAELVRQQVLAIDPSQGISDALSMEDVLDSQLDELRVVSYLVTFFAVLAVFLALLGLYGVIAYSVTGMTREIGIRMALGANSNRIFRLLLGDCARLVVFSIALSGIAALALPYALNEQMNARMSGLLYGVDPQDPVFFLMAAGCLAMAAMAAGFIPAWRAARLEAAEALRYE